MLSNKPDITIFAILVFIIGLILLLMSARFRLNKRIRTNEMNSLVDTRLSDKDNAIRAAAFQFLLASYTSLRRADLNQYLLFAVLALTALFMVFAGLIADIDRRVLGANDLSTQKREAEDSLERAQRSLLDIYKTIPVSSQWREILVPVYTQPVSIASKHLERIEEAIANDLSIMQKRDEQALNSDRRMAAALILRISFAAVSIFLVYIMLRNYRYHTIVSAAYLSRFNALCLNEIDTKKFTANSAALSVEHIPFGRDPRHPFIEATDAATSVFRRKPPLPSGTNQA